MIRYLSALGLTIVVEALVLAALSKGDQRRRLVCESLFVNLLTHPLANLFFAVFTGTTTAFIAVEIVVIGAEALLYADLERCGLRRAFLWSLVANVASAALSLVFW